jgi:hypothetical protein
MAIETRSIRILRRQSALGSTQHDIDVDCVERKDDQAGFGLLQDTSVYQCMDIAMDAFYVPFYPARRLSDRERPCPCHRPDQFPAFGGQKPEQQFRAGKANPRTLPDRSIKSPNDNLDERPGIQHVPLINQQVGFHVVILDDTSRVFNYTNRGATLRLRSIEQSQAPCRLVSRRPPLVS